MRTRLLSLVVFGLTGCGLGPTSSSDPSSQQSATQASTAAGSTQAPHAQLVFLPGWVNTQRGAVVRGGHVDVTYSASRMSSCPSPTIIQNARFSPGGQTFSSDEAFGFDVPNDATSVELWFHAVSPGCDQWDSNYGANWRFPVVAGPTPDVGWAGDWGSSTSRDCTHGSGVPEPITIDEYMRERACIFVDLDVWVPGVTDVAAAHPEWLVANVSWSKDGAAATIDPLEYEGINWHNARFRWNVDALIRDQADWSTVAYHFELTSDGVHAHSYAQSSGAERTLVRAFTFSSSTP